MRQRTQAGARAAAVYLWQTIDWGYATGDMGPLANLSMPTCGACNAQLDIFRRTAARSDHFVGGHLTVASFEDQPQRLAAPYAERAVDVRLTQNPLQRVDAQGTPAAAQEPATSITQRVFCTWTSTGWKVAATGRVAS